MQSCRLFAAMCEVLSILYVVMQALCFKCENSHKHTVQTYDLRANWSLSSGSTIFLIYNYNNYRYITYIGRVVLENKAPQVIAGYALISTPDVEARVLADT